MLTGRVFDATEAATIGLVLSIVENTDLLNTAIAKARGSPPIRRWQCG